MKPIGPLALGLLGVLLPGPSAQAQSLDDGLADLRTAARVEQALGRHAELHAFEYDLRVERGVLTLVGALPNRALRQEALALAGATPGVRQVVDSLLVPDAAPPEPPVDSLAQPEAAPPAPEPVIHTVRRGDTLFRIARQYDVTVADLRRLNGLRSNTIDIGQRIRVR